MRRSDHWIGFDRRIELSWLDFAATRVADGASESQIRADLKAFLQSRSDSSGSSGTARGKTVTVIVRIWGAPDPHLAAFNASLAEMFSSVDASERLGVHWAMTLAAYPYFFAYADLIGRVLALQDTISSRQIRDRIAQQWGDRSTVHRTSQHVTGTMLAWDCLKDAGKGIYRRGECPRVVGSEVAMKLVQAVLLNASGDAMSLDQVSSHPSLFPFQFAATQSDVRRCRELEMSQEGAGTMMVRLADDRTLSAVAIDPEQS